MINFNSRPKRKVPTPETVGPHRSTNPLFAEPEKNPAFQRRVLSATAIVLGLIGAGLIIQGQWWQINDISISGVRDIDPKSVQRVTEQYIAMRRWGVIPNKNLFLLSPHQTEMYLQKKIEERISIDHVVVTKLFPRSLHVTITERVPIAYVRTGETVVSIDKQGKIIEVVPIVDPARPLIEEQTDARPGNLVFESSVMSSVAKLDTLLHETSIQVTSWSLPIVTCPTYRPPEEPSNINQNENTNQPLNNENSNSNLDANTNAPLNLNSRLNPFTSTCSDQELKQTRPEITIQLKDGPQARFDRFQDLEAAVQRVRRILAQPDLPKEYIDVRFGDRVFVK